MNTNTGLPSPPATGAQPPAPNAGPLEQILALITTSTNHTFIHSALKGYGDKDTRDLVFASLLPGGQDPLFLLDVQSHTVGYLYLLSARLAPASLNAPTSDQIENFCAEFDPVHARIAPERITLLVRGLQRIAEASNYTVVLQALYNLVTRYPPTPAHLTNIHPVFVRGCVATRNYSFALPVLENPITEISTQISDFHYNDHLIYHYSGGLAFLALRRWAEAEEFFELVITNPAQAPSALQFEAFKKWALVQLILYGKTKEIPKYTHTNLQRIMRSSVYMAIAKAYPSDRKILASIMEKEEQNFANDTNLGLVRIAYEHAPRWCIKKLTETYLTLSLAEIGKEIDVADENAVRELVLSMIEREEIHASLSPDGTVVFEERVPTFKPAEIEAILKIARAQGTYLANLDREMGRSKEYIMKALKSKDETAWTDEDVFKGERPMGNWAEEMSFH